MMFTYSCATNIKKPCSSRITLFILAAWAKLGRHQVGRSGTKGSEWWNESCIDLPSGDLGLMLLQPTDFPAAPALEEP